MLNQYEDQVICDQNKKIWKTLKFENKLFFALNNGLNFK